MSENPIHPHRGEPLSVGNVVSAALRVYRDHLKLYATLALRAYLWAFVPIYGWAKSGVIIGIISRLVFHELIERPETVNDARRYVNPRKWDFLLAYILFFVIFSLGLFGFAIVLGIVALVLGLIIGLLGQSENLLVIIVFAILILLSIFALIFGYVWLISRLFLFELPLAVEDNIDATSALGRSWQLTKEFVLRIQGIVAIAFSITLPLYILFQVIVLSLQWVLFWLFQNENLAILISSLFSIGLSILANTIFQPFWQAIKAVIYYDLRSRREGMGLQLRK